MRNESLITSYSLPFTLYSLLFTLYSLLFTLYSLPFTLYSLRFTLYSSTTGVVAAGYEPNNLTNEEWRSRPISAASQATSWQCPSKSR